MVRNATQSGPKKALLSHGSKCRFIPPYLTSLRFRWSSIFAVQRRGRWGRKSTLRYRPPDFFWREPPAGRTWYLEIAAWCWGHWFGSPASTRRSHSSGRAIDSDVRRSPERNRRGSVPGFVLFSPGRRAAPAPIHRRRNPASSLVLSGFPRLHPPFPRCRFEVDSHHNPTFSERNA